MILQLSQDGGPWLCQGFNKCMCVNLKGEQCTAEHYLWNAWRVLKTTPWLWFMPSDVWVFIGRLMCDGRESSLISHEEVDRVSRTSSFDKPLFDFWTPYLDRSADMSWCSGVRGIDENVPEVAKLFMGVNPSQTPALIRDWSHLGLSHTKYTFSCSTPRGL